MLMYYVFTQDSVFRSIAPKGSEPTWQTSMFYSYLVLLIYVNKTIYLLGNLPVFKIHVNHFIARDCCRKVDSFQGLKLGSCLTLRNELSEEIHVLTKQDILWGRCAQEESSRVREPRRTTLPRGSQARVLWLWDSFLGCLWAIIMTQSPSWWLTHCSSKMDVNEKDSGRWSDAWCHRLTFPELFHVVVVY